MVPAGNFNEGVLARSLDHDTQGNTQKVKYCVHSHERVLLLTIEMHEEACLEDVLGSLHFSLRYTEAQSHPKQE